MRYDTKLECIDWRYSAAIVGLVKYFKYFNIQFNEGYDESGKEVDYIEYNSGDITLEKFLEFSEYYFDEDMHHRFVENCLEQDEFSEEQIKLVNQKISTLAAMRKVFGKTKFDGSNSKEILELIQTNRQQIIQETFLSKKNMYPNYCNSNLFFTEPQALCRLAGYYVDPNRKTKSISYNFNAENFVSSDRKEFDFIVFAFTNSYESLFINNNSSIRVLLRTNDELNRIIEEKRESPKGSRNILFEQISKSADFIDYDVEVISKHRENDYYTTLFIRKESIEILRSIKNFEYLSMSYKMNDNYYIDIQKEVINCVLNQLLLNHYIEILLKDEKNYYYMIKQLIKINVIIREKIEGIKNMNDKMKGAYKCAKQVVSKIDKNKVNSYKNKLTSAIIANDYDRVCNILLQLSNFADVTFNFAYDLFEDFEGNKELAYTFINSLQDNKEEEK